MLTNNSSCLLCFVPKVYSATHLNACRWIILYQRYRTTLTSCGLWFVFFRLKTVKIHGPKVGDLSFRFLRSRRYRKWRGTQSPKEDFLFADGPKHSKLESGSQQCGELQRQTLGSRRRSKLHSGFQPKAHVSLYWQALISSLISPTLNLMSQRWFLGHQPAPSCSPPTLPPSHPLTLSWVSDSLPPFPDEFFVISSRPSSET